MICKHCGGSLHPGENHCNRCGKNAPDASNCGGFFDLGQAAAPAPQKTKSPVGLIVTAAAVFAVLLVIIAVLVMKQSQLKAELDAVKEELEEVVIQQIQTEETEKITVTLPDLFGKEKEETKETTLPEV